MFKFKPREQYYLIKLFYNLFIHKTIIVLVGAKGTSLAALDNNKIIDTHFIGLSDQQNFSKYQQYFNKYKNYAIFFLLDNNDCNVKRELIPILQSVVKFNPAEQFINSHIPPADISAYNVYNISSVNGEVWNTMICTLPASAPSFTLIEQVISSNLNFGGIYFLNLEYQSIIQHILLKTNNLKFNEYLQIFSSITDSGGIKFVIKHKNEIIAIKNTEYPIDKSEIYIQGMIEQQISDYLISFKSYITRFELKVCLIFLLTDSIKTLVSQSNFDEHPVIILTPPDLIIPVNKRTFKFLDNAIIELFAESKSFLALNKSIKSITQLNLLNRIVFKPFIAIVILLIGLLLNIKLNIWQNQNNTLELNTKYYEISNEYTNLKQRYPNISDITNLADLYSLESFLKIPVILPFDSLDNFLQNLDKDVELNKISFSILNTNNIVSSSNIEFKMELKFPKKDDLIGKNLVEEHIERLRTKFPKFKFNYIRILEPINERESSFFHVIITIKEN